ncbi:MAG: SprT-like domain-containing protein [Candidatus Binatia bacterium]
MKRPTKTTPTEEAYSELQRAYDVFNRELFGGQLPPCLITLQRKNRTYGYFCGDRWAHHAGTIRDEIALNPVHFRTRGVEAVLSTLVHEMVHLWQFHCGMPSRNGYHNREWAEKMGRVGLIPSDTGEPGGNRTGQRVSHYIQEDGPFAKACQSLLATGFVVSWHDRAQDDAEGRARARQKANTRTKYTCPGCGLNAWARAQAVFRCGVCDEALLAQDAGEGGAT